MDRFSTTSSFYNNQTTQPFILLKGEEKMQDKVDDHVISSTDSFDLWDLKVEVIAGEKPMVCDHQVGEFFHVIGEMIVFPDSGRQQFPMYPLAALLPLLPAKQRMTHNNDWMTSDADVACPDPHCGGRFRITRLQTRTFSHAATTVVPLPGKT